MKNKQTGFTLVEIIIVIAITGLMASLAAVALINARVRSRDTKRIADIKDIRSALELYFHDCNEYPTLVEAGQPISGAENCQGGVYLARVPVDPGTGFNYPYLPCSGYDPYVCASDVEDATYYNLGYELEGKSGGLLPGRYIATPDNLY